MKKKDFIDKTIMKMGDKSFDELKNKLSKDIVKFFYIGESEINKHIFAEKINDWFYMIAFKVGDKFNDFLKKYISDWDNIVDDRIIKETKDKKDGEDAALTRARKLYDRAIALKKIEDMSFDQLVDYSRMMMTLYMAIINNKMEDISDFEYSFDCIDIDKIVEAMKKEKKQVNPFMKKDRFYEADTTFAIAMIIYYHMKSMMEEE